MSSRRILVAPLNWGLGHATRCIPLIKELVKHDFEPEIASDGAALSLLKLEFPHLKYHELPSYNIRYARKAEFLKWKLLLQMPQLLNTIQKEQKATEVIIANRQFAGIISDSRFGVWSSKVPKIFVTHQLNVLSGKTTFLSSFLHNRYIRKYNECWIPDAAGNHNLSGHLGHKPKRTENVRYLGVLSRFEKKHLPVKYDILVLLSGPEPQRSMLEGILLEKLGKVQKRILFVRGIFSGDALKSSGSNLEIVDHLVGKQLESTINSSDLIIARSGYTTIMDLAVLEKKAFFIPTPGQFEQEYLARRLQSLGVAPFSRQEDFSPDMLTKMSKFTGLSDPGGGCDFSQLFRLFERE